MYEYKCNDCGHEFLFRKSNWRPPKTTRCPNCGARSRRIFNAPYLVTDTSNPLKGRQGLGSGYNTDTRAGVRAMERDGVVVTNEQDRDIIDRKRGKVGRDELKKATEEYLQEATP